MSEVLTGRVKAVNDRRGFGFVTLDNRSRDIFFHFKALVKSGVAKIAVGAHVEFTTMDTDRGEQIEEFLNVETRGPEFTPSDWIDCVVKWFNRELGYGFLNPLDQHGDIFIHMETLRDCGFIAGLHEGQRVRARTITNPRGLLAVEIDLPADERTPQTQETHT
jgi:CspA family cold shock protein